MSSAYVETTILTNILLKPQTSRQSKAQEALKRYTKTSLPVYAIKEFKAGPLETYAYFHDKLVTTGSLADTCAAIASFSPYKAYLKSTSWEVIAAAFRLAEEGSPTSSHPHSAFDRDAADRLRLAIATLIMESWRRRRRITTEVVQDLACYTEAAPSLSEDGLFDLKPQKCDPQDECSLAAQLRAHPEMLKALRDAIPEASSRREDLDRRAVLKQLLHKPKVPLDRESCRKLGDAIFAFFCPDDSVLLTTNLRDHAPLAAALGKKAESP
jgi:hypothetical protein